MTFYYLLRLAPLIPRFSDLEWEYLHKVCCICGYHKTLGKPLMYKRALRNATEMSCGSKDGWLSLRNLSRLPQVTCRYQSHRAISPKLTRSCTVKQCVQKVLTVMIISCKFHVFFVCFLTNIYVNPLCSHEIWTILCVADKILLHRTISYACCYFFW